MILRIGRCLCVCENHIFHALSPSQIPSDLFGIACSQFLLSAVHHVRVKLGRMHPASSPLSTVPLTVASVSASGFPQAGGALLSTSSITTHPLPVTSVPSRWPGRPRSHKEREVIILSSLSIRQAASRSAAMRVLGDGDDGQLRAAASRRWGCRERVSSTAKRASPRFLTLPLPLSKSGGRPRWHGRCSDPFVSDAAIPVRRP